MTHVSKRKIEKEIYNKIQEFLLVSFTDIKDKESMRNFLDSFLTKTERTMLAKRLAVAYLLKIKVPDERISEILSVGRPMVEKMRLWLETHGEGYEVAMEVLKKAQLLDEFKGLFLAIPKKMAKPYTGILGQQTMPKDIADM